LPRYCAVEELGLLLLLMRTPLLLLVKVLKCSQILPKKPLNQLTMVARYTIQLRSQLVLSLNTTEYTRHPRLLPHKTGSACNFQVCQNHVTLSEVSVEQPLSVDAIPFYLNAGVIIILSADRFCQSALSAYANSGENSCRIVQIGSTSKQSTYLESRMISEQNVISAHSVK